MTLIKRDYDERPEQDDVRDLLRLDAATVRGLYDLVRMAEGKNPSFFARFTRDEAEHFIELASSAVESLKQQLEKRLCPYCHEMTTWTKGESSNSMVHPPKGLGVGITKVNTTSFLRCGKCDSLVTPDHEPYEPSMEIRKLHELREKYKNVPE